VTPAEVAIRPSRTKIGAGSTSTAGCRSASEAQYCQCVVALRPSSRPASASRNAPVQTDMSRAGAAPCRRSQATTAGCGERVPWPPGTTRVSAVASQSGSSGVRRRPDDVRTAAPPMLAVVTR
jgi:hypothetical protein